MAKSLVAKNTHGVRKRDRGLTKVEKIRALSSAKWHRVAEVYARTHGEEKARQLERALIWSELSFDYGCLFLFGVQPLKWQSMIWENHKRTRLSIARLMNGGGKTTGKALRRLYAGFFRSFAPPLWGQYRMFQFAPQEAQALETKVKIDEILAGRAREQMYIDKATGEARIRRCFASRWIKPQKINGHEGFSFFDGGATLEFVPTAFMGMGKDGTDPMWIDLDEARHEDHLTYLVTRMWIPRFLRVAGHMDIDYTPLDASPELEALLEMAKVSKYWSVFVADQSLRELNPTIRKEDEDLVRETLSSLAPEAIEQVLGGRAIQPSGAKFAMGSVKAMFTTATRPEWIDQLDGLRSRIERRCPKCREQSEGHPEAHLVIGMLDPASSATEGDGIVSMVWDLDAPSGEIDVMYIHEVIRTGEPDGPETIGKVAQHIVDIAHEIGGPVGIDGKSALGHAVKDEMVRIDPDVDLVVVRWDTREEKNEDLDKVKSLVEGAHIRSPFHHKLKIQLLTYVREDRKIAQDYVMCMAVGAHVAWPFLPDYITTAAERIEVARTAREVTSYDAGNEWGPHADFGFGELPDGFAATGFGRSEDDPSADYEGRPALVAGDSSRTESLLRDQVRREIMARDLAGATRDHSVLRPQRKFARGA